MKKLLTGITAFALVITSAFTSYALAFDAGSGTTADSAVITEEDYARGESHSYNGFLYYSCYGENDRSSRSARCGRCVVILKSVMYFR